MSAHLKFSVYAKDVKQKQQPSEEWGRTADVAVAWEKCKYKKKIQEKLGPQLNKHSQMSNSPSNLAVWQYMENRAAEGVIGISNLKTGV